MHAGNLRYSKLGYKYKDDNINDGSQQSRHELLFVVLVLVLGGERNGSCKMQDAD